MIALISTPSFATDLFYTIEPRLAEDELTLSVSIQFTVGNEESTVLSLPHSWAGETDYYRGIRNLTEISSNTKIIPTDKPYEFLLTHRPHATIELRYEVFQYWDESITSATYYRPIIDTKYFHFIGHGVFAVPRGFSLGRATIDIEWLNVPTGWSLANSFAVTTNKQTLNTTVSEFLHAVYTGGDFRVETFDIYGHPLHIAVRGDWQFSLEEFYELAQKIMRIQRSFWNDFHFPHFLISMIPTDSQGYTMGGTGLTDSFALFVGKELDDVFQFQFLLAHELFHTWNGRKIRREQPEPLIYWFSEGFTNYYTRLLNLRGGIIDLHEYTEDLNRVIKRYYTSPVRNETNERVLRDFWSNRDVANLPYQRGDLLAHIWNRRIKLEDPDASLDNIMFDLLEEATTVGTVVSPNSLDRLSRNYISSGVRDDIRLFEEQGETVNPDPNALGPCFSFEYYTAYRFDIGFDYDDEGELVEGVREGSAAYRAGLRSGQTILTRSVWWGSSDKEVTFTVRELDGSQITIQYLPRGIGVNTPRYILDENHFSKDSKQCLEWFGAIELP